MPDEETYNRLIALLSKEGTLRDEDVQELVSLWSHPTTNMVRPHIIGMFQGRMALEQIRFVRRFDRASGDLVATTNRLTWWILVLTVVLPTVSIVASAWPYLTWWITHGFRLH